MQGHTARVSVGLPVFNGERYLCEAMESILRQTYGNLELIVSDNASTDRTAEIVRQFQLRDPRVRYSRCHTNIGAAPNYNRVVGLARGEYFKWMACDDLCKPTFLERCVEVLDANPDVLWCCPRTTFIDASGRVAEGRQAEVHAYAAKECEQIADWAAGARLVRHPLGRESRRPHERFRSILLDRRATYDYYGLIRLADLRTTGLERPFLGGEKALVLEWSLMGRFVEIPQTLQLRREHAGALGLRSDLAALQAHSGRWNQRMFLPRRVECLYWFTRVVLERKLPLGERLRCFATLAGCVCEPWRWRRLIADTCGWQGAPTESVPTRGLADGPPEHLPDDASPQAFAGTEHLTGSMP